MYGRILSLLNVPLILIHPNNVSILLHTTLILRKVFSESKHVYLLNKQIQKIKWFLKRRTFLSIFWLQFHISKPVTFLIVTNLLEKRLVIYVNAASSITQWYSTREFDLPQWSNPMILHNSCRSRVKHGIK